VKRVAYLRSEWHRGDAWVHLINQQIPGCPDTGTNLWRKQHTDTEWAWVYLIEWEKIV